VSVLRPADHEQLGALDHAPVGLTGRDDDHVVLLLESVGDGLSHNAGVAVHRLVNHDRSHHCTSDTALPPTTMHPGLPLGIGLKVLDPAEEQPFGFRNGTFGRTGSIVRPWGPHSERPTMVEDEGSRVMTRKQELTMARVAAAELASAIRTGDPVGIERSQRQLGRFERAGRRHRRGAS
jgi:hypothetical protein